MHGTLVQVHRLHQHLQLGLIQFHGQAQVQKQSYLVLLDQPALLHQQLQLKQQLPQLLRE